MSVTLDQTTVSPGSDVHLRVRVLNGTVSVTGATINFSSTGAGTFSPTVDAGNGNYSSVFSVGLQDSGSNTITVQAAKPGFSPAQTQVTIIAGGLPDLTKSTLFGLPLLLFVAALAALLLIVVGVFVNRRKKVAETSPGKAGTLGVPSYAVKRSSWFPGRLN